MYKAIWIDGVIDSWDNKNQNWYRTNKNKKWYRGEPNDFVALKSLNNSKNVTSEFINEV